MSDKYSFENPYLEIYRENSPGINVLLMHTDSEGWTLDDGESCLELNEAEKKIVEKALREINESDGATDYQILKRKYDELETELSHIKQARPSPCEKFCEKTAFERTIANLKSEVDRLKQAQEWIPLEDKLPDENKSVLLKICFQRFCGGTHVETIEVITGGFEREGKERVWFVGNKSMIWDYEFNIRFCEDDILGWMPEPPQEQQRDA